MESQGKAFGLRFDDSLTSEPAGWLRESGSRLPQSKAGAMLRRATHLPNMLKKRKNFNLSAGHVA